MKVFDRKPARVFYHMDRFTLFNEFQCEFQSASNGISQLFLFHSLGSVKEALDIVKFVETPAIITIGVDQFHHVVKPVGPTSQLR